MDVVAHCASLPGAVSEHPFGPETRVFKVGGKMFAILHDTRVSLKCHPAHAVVLREQWPSVTAGYHLNKRHWNTIELDSGVPDAELAAWIEESYDMVVDSLPRAQREALR
ncbi:MAG: MmcQ/YjbR family DNA-binding protein [Chloroflexi bacterium]|nr:MmcQ/YjbR family DNA-binding protein [Chloroflexota bacterium]